MISVITVVYNAESVIEATIQSVLAQKNVDIEYIIIDGLSTDSTLNIIQRYKDKISKIISEKDYGIYDAMNKGVKKSNGEWIFFLNAGDYFYNSTVLADMLKCNINNSDIIYGNVCVCNKIKRSPMIFNKKSVLLGSMICHQAILAKKETFYNNFFSTDYKIISDRIWIHNALNTNYKILKCNLPITNYDINGISMNEAKLYNEIDNYIKSKSYFYFILYSFRKKILKPIKHLILNLQPSR